MGFRSTSVSDAVAALDERSKEIFRRIVEGYLESGEPLGSRNLSRILPMSLSPASVRNVMSDLEELGLIYSPHVSAGRLPTQGGLRFFVDAFMQVGDLSAEDRANIDRQVRPESRDNPVESMMNEASRMLSGHFARRRARHHLKERSGSQTRRIHPPGAHQGVGSARRRSRSGRKPHYRIAGRCYVVAADGGREFPQCPYVWPDVAGIAQAAQSLKGERPPRARRVVPRSRRARHRGVVWRCGRRQAAAAYYSRPIRICSMAWQARKTSIVSRMLFDDLEKKDSLIELLNLAETGPGVRIFIGSENKLFSLSGSSLIVAPYRDDDDRIVGAVGVIGPTRLNYSRIVPMVDYTAQLISRLARGTL